MSILMDSMDDVKVRQTSQAIAITAQQYRTVIQAATGEEWGTDSEDAKTLAADLIAAGFLVQRIDNVVRIVRERIVS